MATKALMRPGFSTSIFEDFFKPWNELFDSGEVMGRTITMPPVNVTEDKKHYLVSLAAPGLTKEDFQIDIDGNMLTISSEKEEKKEEQDEKYTRKEYSYTSFSRSFTLPEDVKMDAIDAKYENGVLKMTLPRKEEVKQSAITKKIVVH